MRLRFHARHATTLRCLRFAAIDIFVSRAATTCRYAVFFRRCQIIFVAGITLLFLPQRRDALRYAILILPGYAAAVCYHIFVDAFSLRHAAAA